MQLSSVLISGPCSLTCASLVQLSRMRRWSCSSTARITTIEDTDRQNIADIIVAKHRHGSTGTVSLYFRKELTQFADLEIERTDLVANDSYSDHRNAVQPQG